MVRRAVSEGPKRVGRARIVLRIHNARVAARPTARAARKEVHTTDNHKDERPESAMVRSTELRVSGSDVTGLERTGEVPFPVGSLTPA